MTPSFSIVVCTYNRVSLLANTLDSLSRLHYAGQFEIIVVNGPSSDATEALLHAWGDRVRIGRCELANLSASRNIGICMAQGDIVAFIDDDAIAEAEWLTHLAQAYADPQVGAAGGIVIGHTGYERQYEYASANRLGGAQWCDAESSPHLCFPWSYSFPYLQGTNASFRRSVLLELGGFDEEFEYYLDETELCCRLIDAGFMVRQLPNAFVHHKFAPSAIRDHQHVVRHHYPIIKNKIYFSLKHGGAYLTPAQIEHDNRQFIDALRRDVEWHIAGGRLPPSALGQFDADCQRAWLTGVARARAAACYITPEAQARWHGDFLPYPQSRRPERRSVALVSADYPPGHSGGIATYTKALAEALAARGDTVHVITRSSDINRVDLEHGVWVHRMTVQPAERPATALACAVPQHIWDWAATAHREAARIARHATLDLVEAPVWDAEGIAFLLDRRWPLVTALQTTLHFWLDSHPEYRADADWMASFGTPMLALERQLMQCADAVRAISSAIRSDIEATYGFHFDDSRVALAPLGLPADAAVPGQPVPTGVTVLFVGRLEYRKGIDVLLAAVPAVLAACPQARIQVIGDCTLPDSQGTPPSARFLAAHAHAPWLDRIHFEGKVDAATLRAAYAGCDLFVAPSRFESFGLVFLEAMREGKAAIGCRAGGMPEVVEDGVTGVLVPPGDAAALSRAIQQLLVAPEQRVAMGAAGTRRFAERYTADHMAAATDQLYRIATAAQNDALAQRSALVYNHGLRRGVEQSGSSSGS